MLLEARLPLSFLIKQVRNEAFAVLGMTLGIEILVSTWRPFLPDIPVAIPAFLGTAISLILSFKLNQSYDRWWEARKVWGAIVNDSRTLMRQTLVFPQPSTGLSDRIGRRQIAFSYCLGQTLRGQDWSLGAGPYLRDDELVVMSGQANKPLWLLQGHADDITQMARTGALTDYQRMALDDTLTRLNDSMGKAERIRNTVFPRTYRLFLHIFIYLFIVLLSIALSEVEGFWQIVVTLLIGVPFFLLEQTATFLQDPFSNRETDVPVTSIARTIEINLLQMMGENAVPEPEAPQGYYLM